jgi:hypothetical protein
MSNSIAQCLQHLILILKVPGSNLGSVTGYIDRGYVFFLITFKQVLGQIMTFP